MIIELHFAVYKLFAKDTGWESGNKIIEDMSNETVGVNKNKGYTPSKAISIVKLAQKMYPVTIVNVTVEKTDVSDEGTIY